MLGLAKAIARSLINTAADRFGGDLRPHQELAGIISDMLIEIYACESAYLRACKIINNPKAKNKEIVLQIAKVLSVGLFDALRSLSSRGLPAILNAGVCVEVQAALGQLLSPPPIDTIAVNRQLADWCVKKKGYPFKIY